MRSGAVSARPPLAPRNSASASSCWPTVRANEGNAGTWQEDPTGRRALTLNGSAELWTTPGAADGDKGPVQYPRGNPSLGQSAALWTPRASENENRTTHHQPSVANGHGRALAAEASSWACLTAADGSRSTDPETSREGATSLTGQSLLWGTPRANDWKDDSPGSAPVNGYLSRQAREHETNGQPSSPSGQTSPLRLNPAFVCWLMGWPEGWSDAGRSLAPTSYERWVTASSRWLRRLLSSPSPNEPAADARVDLIAKEAPMRDGKAPYASQEWTAIVAALRAERDRRAKRSLSFSQAEQAALARETAKGLREAVQGALALQEGAG